MEGVGEGGREMGVFCCNDNNILDSSVESNKLWCPPEVTMTGEREGLEGLDLSGVIGSKNLWLTRWGISKVERKEKNKWKK